MNFLKIVCVFAAFAVFFVTAAQAQPRPPQKYRSYHPTSSISCPYKSVCVRWGPKSPGDLSGPCIGYAQQRVCRSGI
jgi:hypothetical protein